MKLAKLILPALLVLFLGAQTKADLVLNPPSTPADVVAPVDSNYGIEFTASKHDFDCVRLQSRGCFVGRQSIQRHYFYCIRGLIRHNSI